MPSFKPPSPTRAALRVNAQNLHGECVLWDSACALLRWTDIARQELWSLDPVSGAISVRTLPERLCSFALCQTPQQLLCGLAAGLALADLGADTLLGLAVVEGDAPSTRLNDGRCDRHGNFIFGTLDESGQQRGHFYRYSAQGQLQRLALPPALIPNSICFSPDGATLYFADSLSAQIHCCDYAADSGEVSAPRRFAELPGGEPDGSLIDAEGCLWNAQWGLGRVARYRPDGRLDRIVEVPVSQPSCVAFGGPGLDTLFISTARKGLSPAAAALEPLAGGLFALQLDDVRGLPEARYGLPRAPLPAAA